MPLPVGCDRVDASNFQKGVYENNDKIAFLVCFYDNDEADVTKKSSFKIINEDGKVVKDLGYATYGSTKHYVFKLPNGKMKLMFNRLIQSPDYSLDNYTEEIYSLPGTGTSGLSESYSKEGIGLYAYPNPATDYITLPYSLDGKRIGDLKIYDLNGILIESKKVGGDFNEIQLDVSSYKSGTYVYNCNGTTRKFTVK